MVEPREIPEQEEPQPDQLGKRVDSSPPLVRLGRDHRGLLTARQVSRVRVQTAAVRRRREAAMMRATVMAVTETWETRRQRWVAEFQLRLRRCMRS